MTVAPALRAFVYLTVTSARNGFRQRLRRVRQPRYAVATLLALLYFASILLPSWHGSNSTPATLFLREDVLQLVSVAALGLVIYWWLFGKDSGALAFSPAEVQFLFAAPTTRRQLIQFKLIRVQAVILLNIVLWTAILGRGRGTGELMWVRPLSLWAMLSTMQLHRLGATLTRTNLTSHGAAGLRRSGIAAAILLVMVGAVVVGVVDSWPVGASLSPFELMTAVRRAAARPPAEWVLLPVRAVLAPLFAPTLGEWARAMGPAMAIMLAHFAWVLRSDAAFEDAAVQASAARAQRAVRRRSGLGDTTDRRHRRLAFRLPLAPLGEPAVAIAWKNVLAAVRSDHFFKQALIFGVGALAAGVAAFVRPSLADLITGIIAAWSVMLLVMGPVWLRNDLRADLPRLELLRTFPVEPRRFVAAEVGSTALILCSVQLLLVAAIFIAQLRNPGVRIPLDERAALAIAVALGLPVLNALGASIHNAAALLFPGWMPLGAERKAGVEAMGQVYLTLIVVVVLLAVLLVLPVAVGALAFLLFVAQYGYWSAIAAVIVGSAVASGELALMVRWLGNVFARIEPADVGSIA
ncbi:MAG: putative ABC exporter domain-containing protein [Gemmatimonadaceae bacterium]